MHLGGLRLRNVHPALKDQSSPQRGWGRCLKQLSLSSHVKGSDFKTLYCKTQFVTTDHKTHRGPSCRMVELPCRTPHQSRSLRLGHFCVLGPSIKASQELPEQFQSNLLANYTKTFQQVLSGGF